MATTITQARPLLTVAELELFDQSRAEPIKSLTPARLRGKVTRTRTLRDKYRDLYRRQTVAVRTARGASGRSPMAANNERTERKAQILQEVLERFEARLAYLEERDARSAARENGRGAKSRPTKALNSAPAGSSKATARSERAGASDSGSQAASVPDSQAAPKKAVRSRAARSTAPRNAGEATVDASVTGTAPRSTPSTRSKSKAPRRVAAAVSEGHEGGSVEGTPAHPKAESVGMPSLKNERSAKAPSDRAPAANGKAQAPQPSAPVDLLPAALRSNPLKQSASQIAIHAHQSSSIRRAQGKRDSR
jgi:hypothetical protein